MAAVTNREEAHFRFLIAADDLEHLRKRKRGFTNCSFDNIFSLSFFPP